MIPKYLLVTGFELWMSGVGSDAPVSRYTTTEGKMFNF